MENNTYSKRAAHCLIVLGVIIFSGVEIFLFVRNFHRDVHVAVVKVIAFPFTLVGIPMRVAERNPVMIVSQDTLAMETFMNAIVYMTPLALAYVLLMWRKTARFSNQENTKRSSARFPTKKTVFWIGFYLFQFAMLVFLIFTGLGMAIGIPIWVSEVIEPVDYMNTGLLRYHVVALAYNVFVLWAVYEFVGYVISSSKAVWR